ncbi:MAG: hypothetical protein JWM38_1806, partial [Sphingomonas bacterium]|nr:hypothetical protein [Sphingomonas bacterium]
GYVAHALGVVRPFLPAIAQRAA